MDVQQFNMLLSKAHTDAKCFGLLYSFYYKRIVMQFCKKFGKEFAEDVAQDFFIKIIKSDKKYEYINSPTAWVYTCCINIAKTKLTKENSKILFNEEFGTEANFDFDSDFEKLCLDLELDGLDDETKKIIFLHYWEGYCFEEISEILGISYDALRQRHKRLKKKLKNILN